MQYIFAVNFGTLSIYIYSAFGTPSTKYFFDLKKIYESVRNQNRVKMWSSFLKEFFKIFKIKDFGFTIFEKGHILRPF